MNTDLQQFALHCLRLVLATVMPVFFIAFLTIPYSLGGHPDAIDPSACLACATQAAAATPARHSA